MAAKLQQRRLDKIARVLTHAREQQQASFQWFSKRFTVETCCQILKTDSCGPDHGCYSGWREDKLIPDYQINLEAAGDHGAKTEAHRRLTNLPQQTTLKVGS
jgi:hypothetical protein